VKDPGVFEKDHAWWHVQYRLPITSADGDFASIMRTQTDIAEVLQDMSEISEKTVLVYASDAAFSTSPIPLPPKLETFVKKDNMSFQQEVAAAEAAWTKQDQDQDQDRGNQAFVDWSEGGNGWGNETDAKQGYQQGTFGSTLSSKTLTPSTDPHPPPYHDEDEVVNITLSPEHESEQPVEMQEINGGISAWAGASNASSETVGLEPLEVEPMSDVVVGDGRESRTGNRAEDVLMADPGADADADGEGETETEGETEHIEVVERKGG
jgi:hypothetical protein